MNNVSCVYNTNISLTIRAIQKDDIVEEQSRPNPTSSMITRSLKYSK